MKKIVNIAFAILFSLAFIASCFAQEAVGAAKLIKEAKTYIEQGDSEKAISSLDSAFGVADSGGDAEALIEIGDLYIRIDPSLKDKAMQAWTSAGRWQCR